MHARARHNYAVIRHNYVDIIAFNEIISIAYLSTFMRVTFTLLDVLIYIMYVTITLAIAYTYMVGHTHE